MYVFWIVLCLRVQSFSYSIISFSRHSTVFGRRYLFAVITIWYTREKSSVELCKFIVRHGNNCIFEKCLVTQSKFSNNIILWITRRMCVVAAREISKRKRLCGGWATLFAGGYCERSIIIKQTNCWSVCLSCCSKFAVWGGGSGV